MQKRKRTSILIGESNLTEEQRREFEIRHRAEREANILDMAESLARKNPQHAFQLVERAIRSQPKYSKKFKEIVARPRAGKRGPQLQDWEEKAFLAGCLIMMNAVKKRWIKGNLSEAWGRIGDMYGGITAESAQNKFYLLKAKHSDWFEEEASKGFERT